MINETNYKNTAVKCIHCKSNNYTKQGYRNTENRGKIQKYLCRDCNRYFTNDEGFYRMRNAPQKITLCLDLFFRGVSTRKVQEHLQTFYPKNSSWVSIYSWVVKYAKQISKFTDKLKLNVGEEIQVDEVEYFRRKSHKARGVDKNWFIDSVCPETKFMVASDYVSSRSKKNIKKVMERIKEKVESPIKVITTDGLTTYQNVVKKTFGYNLKEGKYNIIHNRIIADEDGFNHPIERLHGNQRSRTKTMRGFHGSISSANAIMKGFEIYYNFITKHQAIDCCPYELAIPELKDKLEVNNKWLELIHLSNKN